MKLKLQCKNNNYYLNFLYAKYGFLYIHFVFGLKYDLNKFLDWKRSVMDLKNKCSSDRTRSVKVERRSWGFWTLLNHLLLWQSALFSSAFPVCHLFQSFLIPHIRACAECCHGNPQWTVRSCYLISCHVEDWQLRAGTARCANIVTSRVCLNLSLIFFLCFPVLMFLLSASFSLFYEWFTFNFFSLFIEDLFCYHPNHFIHLATTQNFA